MKHFENVLQRKVLSEMFCLHALQRPLDVAAHLPRPDGRFIGFETFPPFLKPGFGFEDGAD